jgi:hypothetical protein
MHRLIGILGAALVISGCGTVYVPLPAQRTEQPHTVRAVLDMTGGRPENTWGVIDAGVFPTFQPGSDWRWAGDHCAFHFKLSEFTGWTFTAHITAVKAVLDKTGPQKIEFKVNGRAVASADLKVSRDYHFEIPLDPSLLQQDSPVTVSMDSGPCLPQKDGLPFCVLLHSLGFTKLGFTEPEAP